MIITITLNPAVDKTIYINGFEKGEVNKVAYSVKDPGGKGINVSRVVKNLNCDTMALGFIGGENGGYIKGALLEKGIDHRFTEASENTRSNIKIVDLVSGNTTDVNEKGNPITSEEQRQFLQTYSDIIKKDDIIVIAGSVPQGIDSSLYRQLIVMGREMGNRVILDTSGDLLKEGIKGKPYLIKPNIEELEEILGRELNDQKTVIGASREIIKTGVEMVCVSMGNKGAMLIGKDFVYHSRVPKVKVKSTVGAGDALVAGFAAGLCKKATVKMSFKMGMASSVVAVTKEGTKAPSYNEVRSMLDKIEII